MDFRRATKTKVLQAAELAFKVTRGQPVGQIQFNTYDESMVFSAVLSALQESENRRTDIAATSEV